MSSIRALVVIATLALPSLARADAVDPCPPGFDPSHSGCRFDPDLEDLGVIGCCAASIGVLAAAGIAIGWRARRSRSSREP